MTATARKPRLLRIGNSKLGPGIWNFSLPAKTTCPGATAACLAVCYATRGHFRWDSNQQAYRRNLQATRRDSFVGRVLEELRQCWPRVVRVHVSGDFYSDRYVDKWRQIAAKAPETSFLAYTRSWRDPLIRPALEVLAELSNFYLWYSEDVDSGPSPAIGRIRRAFMARHDGELDVVEAGVNMVFRNHPCTVAKKVAGVQVCPVENGIKTQPPITCMKCRLCFTPTPGALSPEQEQP